MNTKKFALEGVPQTIFSATEPLLKASCFELAIAQA
jgi:hypothetical protein